MRTIIKIIKKWLPLAIATAGICGLVYVAVQQTLRIGANDPQIQMAEDAAGALNNGASVDSLLPAGKVEISTSLAPFIMVFDNSDRLLASTAILHGNAPDYPSGVLDAALKSGEDRVTWQPENGVRMATIAVSYDQGVVVAGRSLREVEMRIDNIGTICLLAVLAIWAVTIIFIAAGEVVFRKG